MGSISMPDCRPDIFPGPLIRYRRAYTAAFSGSCRLTKEHPDNFQFPALDNKQGNLNPGSFQDTVQSDIVQATVDQFLSGQGRVLLVPGGVKQQTAEQVPGQQIC